MEKVVNKRTCSEIYEIINILGEDYKRKIPQKLYLLIDNARDKEYKPNLLREDGSLNEEALGKETISLFAVLNYKYFVEDKQEKNKIMKIYEENEEKYQQKISEKYNSEKIFENKVKVQETETPIEKEIVVYEDNFFIKVKNWLKNIFNISRY